MSKFFLTNSSDLYREIRQCVSDSEYNFAFDYNCGGIYALSTKKLVVDNVNGLRCGNGFAIVTGTMTWGNGDSICQSSLVDIYKSFSGFVDSIYNNSIGNYAVSILKDDILYVFGEIAGFYNIYHYCQGIEWLVSNSLYDMAIALKGRLTFNRMAIVESTVQDGILLDDTYYNEIHRLSGFNHIEIKGENFNVIKREYDYPMATGTIDEKVGAYVGLQKKYATEMSSAYGVPVISMTGGLDARMVMASYLAAGIKPQLYYGTGNSFITNTKNEDKEIDLVFSRKYGLTFHDADWSTPLPMDKYWGKYLKQYGFLYDSYAGSDAVVESIRNIPSQLFTFGYCGELLRSLSWVESRNKDFFTIEEYLDEFYIPRNVRMAVVDSEEYYEYIKSKQERICKHYHLDEKHIANEDIFYLSLERRKSADASMLNHVNLMKYCCYTLGQYESLVAGRVTCKEAENSGFMLRCIDAMTPSALDVPVFSHCSMRKFYRDTMSLSPQNKSLSFKKRVKKELKNKIPGIVELTKRLIGRKNVWHNAGDAQIYEYALSLFDSIDLFHIVNRNCLDGRRLINYIMKIYALKSVG